MADDVKPGEEKKTGGVTKRLIDGALGLGVGTFTGAIDSVSERIGAGTPVRDAVQALTGADKDAAAGTTGLDPNTKVGTHLERLPDGRVRIGSNGTTLADRWKNHVRETVGESGASGPTTRGIPTEVAPKEGEPGIWERVGRAFGITKSNHALVETRDPEVGAARVQAIRRQDAVDALERAEDRRNFRIKEIESYTPMSSAPPAVGQNDHRDAHDRHWATAKVEATGAIAKAQASAAGSLKSEERGHLTGHFKEADIYTRARNQVKSELGGQTAALDDIIAGTKPVGPAPTLR